MYFFPFLSLFILSYTIYQPDGAWVWGLQSKCELFVLCCWVARGKIYSLLDKNRFFNCVLEHSLNCMLFFTRQYLWYGFQMKPMNSLCTGRNKYFKTTTKVRVPKQTPWALLKYPCMCLYLVFFFFFSLIFCWVGIKASTVTFFICIEMQQTIPSLLRAYDPFTKISTTFWYTYKAGDIFLGLLNVPV